MDALRTASNIHGIASLAVLLWLLVAWLVFLGRWGLPWLRAALGRRGFDGRSSSVAAALLEHEEVCGRCAYPRAAGEACPECGLPYANGLARRRDEADRRQRERRTSLRWALRATIALALLWASGYLADGVYARVNMKNWGVPYPRMCRHDLNLIDVTVIMATSGHSERVESRLLIRAKGIANPSVYQSFRQGAPRLRDARVQLMVQTGADASLGFGPTELPTPWLELSTPDHPIAGAPTAERAVADAYAAAELGVNDPHIKIATDAIDAVLHGSHGLFRIPGASVLRVQGQGYGLDLPTPFAVVRPAALAGAAAGAAPLVLGLLLFVWAWRRSRAAKAPMVG